MKNTKDNINLGLVHIGKREKSGLQILEKLKQQNIKVNQWDVLSGSDRLKGIDEVNVIVVNIGITHFEYDDLLSDLFEKNVKVIINEAVLTNNLSGYKRHSWERHLLNKIDSSFSINPDITKVANIDEYIDLEQFGIDSIWVLAASIGGPDAIQKFLSEFTGNEKVMFIIMQHMDKEFVPMMVEQFDKQCALKVVTPISGMKIVQANCIVHPTDELLHFNSDGTLEIFAMNEVYAFSPCIDAACVQLIKNVKNLNIAIFSGMSTDGIEASKLLKGTGSKVITQTESSCVLSTIIAGVKENVKVDFDGTPEEMAHYIIKSLP